jgi:hypothetical protein
MSMPSSPVQPESNPQDGTPCPTPLIQELLADRGNPVEAVVLLGYIGNSSKEGYTRLYLDLQFKNYYEIPSAAIILSEPVDQSRRSSKTIFVVKADASLEIVQIAQASFIKGNIISLYFDDSTSANGMMQIQTHQQTPAHHCY